MLVTLLVVAPLPVLTRLFALARLVPIASKLRADELPGFCIEGRLHTNTGGPNFQMVGRK